MLTENKTQMICENLSRNPEGELCFAGMELTPLAKKYGTPLYLYDEERIRERCRTYIGAVKEGFGSRGKVLYASKAASFKRLYEIMKEEGMGIDVVSSGEIYSASSAGFDLANAYFHSNNKTDIDIEYAIDMGVGYFVVDNEEELYAINRIARERDAVQKVLLRITPGIDPHTHKAISTGSIDSKFGVAIETGQADELIKLALEKKHIALTGFHCHIGSQIFESEPFCEAAEIMITFASHIRESLGFTASEINIGGGMAVRYLEEHPEIDYAANIAEIAKKMRETCEKCGFPFPSVRMEPGRSIVADAGMTLYSAGTVKVIPGFKKYLSIDGGMPDNPRYALYESPYTVEIANKMNEEKDFVCTLAGRCCESGDIIQENVPLPNPERGDVVAVLTTGAYNHSMASNYNRIPRPPVVMIADGVDKLVLRRETFSDMLACEV